MARFFQPKKSKLNTKHQRLVVEKLDNLGAGIGYLDGKPVFIPSALPNEEVLIQLSESKKNYSRAKVIKRLTSADERVEPFCPHYQQCGGCHFQHLSEQAQTEHKQQSLMQLMEKLSGQTVPLDESIVSESTGYRRRTRLSLMLDKKSHQLAFGFRKQQSNQIVNIAQCAVLDPELNALLPALKTLFLGFKKKQVLGHVELVKADNGVVMVLRHTQALAPSDSEALQHFASEHALTLYSMPSENELVKLTGDQPMYQEVGTQIAFQPNNFIQVNQKVNQQMVARATQWLELDGQDRVLDLFCGVGNFSLPIAKVAQQVVGVEGVQAMVDQAAQNALCNQLSNVEFHQANLELDIMANSWAHGGFDKVLLDPARAGAAGVVEQVGQLNPTRVVYVSCNAATLARDSQSLYAQGYTLSKLAMLDMFPHTHHFESMALFVKN